MVLLYTCTEVSPSEVQSDWAVGVEWAGQGQGAFGETKCFSGMIVFLVQTARFAGLGLHLVDTEEGVGDTADRLAVTTPLLQDVRRLLQAGDPVHEEQ